jgi:hypothetical protein
MAGKHPLCVLSHLSPEDVDRILVQWNRNCFSRFRLVRPNPRLPSPKIDLPPFQTGDVRHP